MFVPFTAAAAGSSFQPLISVQNFDKGLTNAGIAQIWQRSDRRVLTGKTGPRCYYKGKGCSAAGFNTQDAKYLVDRNRIHQFVVPDLTGFPLKPYVDSHDTR